MVKYLQLNTLITSTGNVYCPRATPFTEEEMSNDLKKVLNDPYYFKVITDKELESRTTAVSPRNVMKIDPYKSQDTTRIEPVSITLPSKEEIQAEIIRQSVNQTPTPPISETTDVVNEVEVDNVSTRKSTKK